MAVMVRCSCPSSRPNPTVVFRSSPPPSHPRKFILTSSSFAAKPDVTNWLRLKILKDAVEIKRSLESEIMPLLPFKWRMILSSSYRTSMRTKVSFESDQVLSSKRSLHSYYYVSQMTEWKEICATGQKLPGSDCMIAEQLLDHQRMAFFNFSTTFVIINALLFTLPAESLAESCEADSFSIFNMPLLFAIALIGATVGGLVARQRKGELKRLNDQLRQINAALRRQAKIESYAPNLSYAPVGRIPEKEVIVDSRKQELTSNLKMGKKYLRNQEPERAFAEFKAALELAQSLGDPIEEKKAARGLGASLQRQRKYKDAIKYHSMILAISEREGEDSGNTEAYGAIADCYTELGDLEQAGKFYDQYISRLESDN